LKQDENTTLKLKPDLNSIAASIFSETGMKRLMYISDQVSDRSMLWFAGSADDTSRAKPVVTYPMPFVEGLG
jgi:hypothetical protein